MSNRRTIAPIAIGLLLVAALHRAASADEILALGAGANRCSVYLASARQDSALTRSVYYTWAIGFMTGLNFAFLNFKSAEDRLSLLDTYSQDDFEQRMHAFCQTNPSSYYMDGVVDLYASMQSVPR
jgi:hypothetical protein